MRDLTCLVDAALPEQRVDEIVERREACTELDGRAGEPFGQRVIGPRLARCLGEGGRIVRLPPSGLEADQRALEAVDAPPFRDLRQDRGESFERFDSANTAESTPYDLGVERVRDAHLRSVPCPFHDHEAEGLGLGHGARARRRLELVEPQRLRQSEDLESPACGLGRVREVLGYQLVQTNVVREVAAPRPNPTTIGEACRRHTAVDELAQDEGVAAGQCGEPGGRGALDRRAQPGRQQGSDGIVVERFDGHDIERAVFDERRDRGRRYRVVACHDHERDAGGRERELVHDRRGRVIEHVCVVDDDECRPRRR